MNNGLVSNGAKFGTAGVILSIILGVYAMVRPMNQRIDTLQKELGKKTWLQTTQKGVAR